MAKKKKKKKKTSISAQNQLQNLSFKELLERGERFINIGRPRDAVSVLRFAMKKHGQTDEVTRPLFRAYMVRASQLREKGMHAEAQAVHKTAQDFLPSMEELSPDDMLAYMLLGADREAFDLYASYVRVNGPLEAAERQLADRLVQNGCWDEIKRVKDDRPLKRHAQVAEAAVAEMKAGQWEMALEKFKSVPRTSPFAPLRLFCRAMVAFYAEDDSGALSALERLPEDFFLIPAANDIRAALDRNSALSEADYLAALERLDCLWDAPVRLASDMKMAIRHLDKGRFPDARKSLQAIAETLTPSSPEMGLFSIIQTLWRMVVEDRLSSPDYRRLAKQLLPQDKADLLLSKAAFMDDADHPFTNAGHYLERIQQEFPDPVEQDMARSAVLERLARLCAVPGNRFLKMVQKDAEGLRQRKKTLGLRLSNPDDPEMIPIELALESARIDPGNRSAYEILADLPRTGRAAKTSVEKGLLAMTQHFPGDPYPDLELARLYYERSAFRKAEKVLQDALEKAPHDPRVVEKNALACLIAAEKNLNRNKLHLVERDSARAGEFDAKKLVPYILEKQILLRLYKGDDLDEFLEDSLSALSATERIKTLAVLLMDLDQRKALLTDAKERRKLELALNNQLAGFKNLTSEDIFRILTPLDRSLLQIYSTTRIAPVLLSKKPELLKGLTDADALELYDKILSPETWNILVKDIKKRIPKARENHRMLLSFFQETLRQIEKKKFRSKEFVKLQNEASPPQKESIRGLSRRLAPHAPEPLKRALEMFQFEILDLPPFPFGGGGIESLIELLEGGDLFDEDFLEDDDEDDYYDEDDYDDDDDYAPAFLDPGEIGHLEDLVRELEGIRKLGLPVDSMPKDMIQGMIDEVEEMVDDMGMRNLPDAMILSMKEIMDAEGQFQKGIKLMGRFMELTGGKPRLSREARALLYGKKKG